MIPILRNLSKSDISKLMNLIEKIYITLFVFLAGVAASYASVNVRVEIPGRSNKVAVGSRFQIIITAQNSPGISWSNPPGTKISYQVQERNETPRGSEEECTLTLTAVTPGTYTYQVSAGSTKSKPVKYIITDAPAGGQGGGGQQSGQTQPGQAPSQNDKPQFIGKGNENMFLKATISKTSVYEQEALLYTIKLYTSYNYIKFLGATAAPKFEGFVVEEDKVTDAYPKFESVNGRTYKAVDVARYIIFPQKAGNLKIIGNTYTVSADAFEYYHDPYWQNMTVRRPVQLNLTPNDLSVNVKDLPSPRPADFSGGVGKFSISLQLPRQTYKTNQASSVSYKVTGQGNLKYIKLPELSSVFPSSIEVFSPETEVNSHVGQSTVSGDVTFKYSFMPMETGNFAVAPLKLVYFNPETQSYETATASGFSIDVAKGSASEKSQTAKRFDSSLLPVGSLSTPERPLVRSFSFWLWFIIPGALFIIFSLCYISYLKRHSDMEAFRSKKAGKIARRRLKKAAECLKRNDSEKFFDEMLFALWGYMGDKLKMPTSELTRQNISEVLMSHGVSEAVTQKAIALIDTCEFAKYAPAQSRDDMRTIYDDGAEVISAMDSEFSRNALADSEETSDII